MYEVELFEAVCGVRRAIVTREERKAREREFMRDRKRSTCGFVLARLHTAHLKLDNFERVRPLASVCTYERITTGVDWK